MGTLLEPSQETIGFLSLGGEEPLEEEMAVHPSVLAWKIPWAEVGGLQSMQPQRVRHGCETEQM